MLDWILAGLSHKNSHVAARERLAVVSVDRIFSRLRAEGFSEGVVLSTCNRFELYLLASAGEQPIQKALSLLEDLAGGPLEGHAYTQEGAPAVRHLFSVAAGLESLVVGETEILGQVKTAYETAKAAGMTGKQGNVLFQRALYVGKKVRNETAIAVGATSVASVAVQLAESIFGRLSRSSVLILGAGAMAELAARHLLSKKVAKLSIANRTRERAEALAGKLKAESLAWEEFPQALGGADIVIASTGSPMPVLTRDMVCAVLRQRAGRSLFIIDIAMPRDVEDSVHGLEHVYLYRLGDLEEIVARNLSNRGGEIERARRLAHQKADEFCDWKRSLAEGREASLKHSGQGGLVASGRTAGL